MIDPISPIAGTTQLEPPILIEWSAEARSTSTEATEAQQSLNRQLALKIKARTASEAAQEAALAASNEPTPWQIPAHEIINLIWQISPSGDLTYNQLRNFRPQNLRDSEIQNFLLEQSLFFVLSQLDEGKQTLSAQDIRRAASLAGDDRTLDRQDLKYVNIPETLPDLDSLDEDTRKPRPFGAPSPDEGLSRSNPFKQAAIPAQTEPFGTGIRPQTVLPMTPDTRAWAATVFQPQPNAQVSPETHRAQLIERVDQHLQSIQAKLSKPLGSSINPLRAQEWMVAAGYLKPLDGRSLKESQEAIHGTGNQKNNPSVLEVEGPIPIQATAKADTSPAFRQMMAPNIKAPAWSVHDLEAFLMSITASGRVSWQQLVDYHPTTPQERLFQELLKNPILFHALAQLDGDGDTLSPEDIEMAAEYDHHPDILSAEDIAHLPGTPKGESKRPLPPPTPGAGF